MTLFFRKVRQKVSKIRACFSIFTAKLGKYFKLRATPQYHCGLVRIYKNATGEWRAKFQVRGTSQVVDKKLSEMVEDNELISKFHPIEIVRLCFEAQEDRKEPKYSVVNKEYNEDDARKGSIYIKVKGEKACRVYDIDEFINNKEMLDNLSRDDLIFIGIRKEIQKELYIKGRISKLRENKNPK